MLKQRIISAAVGLPILLYILIWGPVWAVQVMLSVCVFFSTYEAAKLLNNSNKAQHVAALSVIIFIVAVSRQHISLVIPLLFLLVPISIFTSETVSTGIQLASSTVLSVVYACLPWVCLWDLYVLGDDARYVFLLFSIVMLSDSGAYFVGRKYGKRSLAPRLSPKKSWEGYVAGCLSAVLGASILNYYYNSFFGSYFFIIITSFIVSSAGVLGDLAESAFKRNAGVKDSGKLIPGHGGMLDRADAILFAAPVLWFLIEYGSSVVRR